MEKKDYVYATPVATEYRYYLDDEVSDSQDYHELFELLEGVGENDCVRIIISNFGGSLVTCVAIVNAIRACKGVTIGVLASIAYSAGGAIWLACQGQEVRNHVGFMSHDAIGGSYGSLFQQQLSIEHQRNILRSLYEDVYKHFLNPQEIDEVLKNNDMWMNEQEIIKRLEARDKAFEQEQIEAQKQASADMEAMFDELDPPVPEAILKKLNKQQLIDYALDKIIIHVNEDGTFELETLEDIEIID